MSNPRPRVRAPRSRVRFTGTNNRHTYHLDGRRVFSPSSATGVLNKPALSRWAAREAVAWAVTHRAELDSLGPEDFKATAVGVPDRIGRESMARGSKVHAIAESLVLGEPMPETEPSGEPWAEDVQAMAEHLARFMDAWDPTPVGIETIVYNERDGWAGRLDLVADLADGRRYLLDYKTGASGIWPETALQLAAYRHATHRQIDPMKADEPMWEVDAAAAVWVTPNGCELVPVLTDDNVYRYFLHALALVPWARIRRDTVVSDPLPEPEGVAS